ncbi:hypothetical protein STTU_0790 [Streptomyces sp. Tu6071]|nr:hypothetical protein STTU_0790 [Streptomyces sp. Tu6071]
MRLLHFKLPALLVEPSRVTLFGLLAGRAEHGLPVRARTVCALSVLAGRDAPVVPTGGRNDLSPYEGLGG